jgi:hypothetical protein
VTTKGLPGSLTTPFTFDDEWWARIVPVLPAEIRKSDDSLRRTRRYLERIFQAYRDYPAKPKLEAERWLKVEEGARRLREDLKETAGAQHLQWVSGLLGELASEASINADTYLLKSSATFYVGGRTQGMRRPDREALYDSLVGFWKNFIEPFKPAYGKRLPKFLLEALSGFDDPPNSDAIKDIISRVQSRVSKISK